MRAVLRRALCWLTDSYSPRQRRYLIGFVLIGLAMRLAWVIVSARPPLAGDPVAYVFHGETLARGEGYRSIIGALHSVPVRDLPPTAFYPIGYPGTLAGLFWIVFHTPIPDNLPKAIGVFQALLGVATVVLVSELARRVFGSRVAVFTAGIMAFWPNIIFYTALAQHETVFIFLFVAALVVIVQPSPERGPSWRRVVVFGVVLGLAVLVRPTALMFLPVLALCWVLDGVPWRRALAHIAVVTVIVAVVVSPWLVRNTVVMHATVFSTGIGDAMCSGRHFGATGEYEIAAKYCLDPYDRIPLPRREVVRNRENTNAAIRFVVHHPLEEARLWFWRGYFGYRDDHDALQGIALDRGHLLHDSRIVDVLESVSDAYYHVMLVLALLALPLFLRRDGPHRAWRLCLLLAGVQGALVPFLLYGDPRYKIPALPFIAIGAAVLLSRVTIGRSPRLRDAEHRSADRERHATDDGLLDASEEQRRSVDDR